MLETGLNRVGDVGNFWSGVMLCLKDRLWEEIDRRFPDWRPPDAIIDTVRSQMQGFVKTYRDQFEADLLKRIKNFGQSQGD